MHKLLAALFLCASTAGAQSLESAAETLHAASQGMAKRAEKKAKAPAKDEAEDVACKICWSPSFTPLNEKAKTVKAWEEKRIDVKAAKGVLGFAAFGSLLTPGAWKAYADALREYDRLSGELTALRNKAVALGGMEAANGLVVKITLVKGADYMVDR